LIAVCGLARALIWNYITGPPPPCHYWPPLSGGRPRFVFVHGQIRAFYARGLHGGGTFSAISLSVLANRSAGLILYAGAQAPSRSYHFDGSSSVETFCYCNNSAVW